MKKLLSLMVAVSCIAFAACADPTQSPDESASSEDALEGSRGAPPSLRVLLASGFGTDLQSALGEPVTPSGSTSVSSDFEVRMDPWGDRLSLRGSEWGFQPSDGPANPSRLSFSGVGPDSLAARVFSAMTAVPTHDIPTILASVRTRTSPNRRISCEADDRLTEILYSCTIAGVGSLSGD